MNPHPRLPFFAIVLLWATLIGCTLAPTAGFDRATLFTDVQSDVAVPLYTDFVSTTLTLQSAIATLQANPTPETLAQAQAAWRTAAHSWERTEILAFAADMTLITPIDKWPTRTSFIEEQIAGSEALTSDFIAGGGSTSKGLPALEYLLFDPEVTIEAILARLQTEPRRLDYARATADVLYQDAQALRKVWTAEGDSAFIRNGALANEDVQSSVSMVTNEMVALLETLVRDEISRPLGSRTYGQPDPHAAEGWRSGTSRTNLLANLEGFHWLFTGAAESNALHFDDLLTAQGATYGDTPLSQAILAQYDRAVAAVTQIPEPLDRAVIENPEAVIEAREAITQLLVLVKSDMASQLGVTITFNDNDGD